MSDDSSDNDNSGVESESDSESDSESKAPIDLDRLNDNDETLTDLHIYGKSLNEENYIAYADALGEHEHLRSLTIVSVKEPTLIRHVVEAALVHSPSSVQFLHLANCQLNDDDDDDGVGYWWLKRALKRNKSLVSIILRNNSIEEQGAVEIVEGLMNNKIIEVLDISGNKPKLAGCEKLAAFLKTTCLKQLNVSGCSVGQREARALSEGLIENETLVELRIDSNALGDAGATSIATALHRNGCLRFVWMRSNEITDVGLNVLERTLKHANYNLQKVYLSNNGGLGRWNFGKEVERLCIKNRMIMNTYDLALDKRHSVPLVLWPKVLEVVQIKPDLLFGLLKTHPGLFEKLKRRRSADEDDESDGVVESPKKKRRGRPPKKQSSKEKSDNKQPKEKKKRGRPPKRRRSLRNKK